MFRRTRHSTLLRLPIQSSKPSSLQPITRAFSTQKPLQAYKDDQSKDSLRPRRAEYGESSNDDAAASKTKDTAFDPNNTSPEGQKEAASSESSGKGGNSPLEMSPANTESSQARDSQEGGAAKSPREKASGAGSGGKNGGGKSG